MISITKSALLMALALLVPALAFGHGMSEADKLAIVAGGHTPFSHFVWSFIPGQPAQNRLASLKDAPAQTDLSKAISRALKKEGFRFVGPTTVYAFMQSSGMVNDHLVSCPRHKACAKLHKTLKVPGR